LKCGINILLGVFGLPFWQHALIYAPTYPG